MGKLTRPRLSAVTRRSALASDYADQSIGVSLIEFGADPTGTKSSTQAIKDAFDYAAAHGLRVVQGWGRFLLDGPISITVSCGADLTGSTLVVNGWSGEFLIRQLNRPITYDASNESQYGVLGMFNNSTVLSRTAGTSQLSGLTDGNILENHFIQFTTTQDMFKYQGTVQKRIEFNRVMNQGRLEVPIKYALGANVDTVYALPVNDHTTELRGFTFDLQNQTRWRLMEVDGFTRLRMVDFSFLNKKEITGFAAFLEARHFYDFEMSDWYDAKPWAHMNSAGTKWDSSYTFSLYNGLKYVGRNLQADGMGWGVIGSSDCSRVSFYGSNLNRIDFHKPFQGYLKVVDCNLGQHGITSSCLGDLIMIRTTFSPCLSPFGEAGGVFSCRGDAPGVADGDLIMRDCKLMPFYNGAGRPQAVIFAPSEDVFDTSGSPISGRLFNNIMIDNLAGSESQSESTKFPKLIACPRVGAYKAPKSITVRNYNTNNAASSVLGLRLDLSGFTSDVMDSTAHAVSMNHNIDIKLEDINATHCAISGANNMLNPRVVISNLRNDNYAEQATVLDINQRGSYELHGCVISNFEFVEGKGLNGVAEVKMIGGILRRGTGDFIANGSTVLGTDITLNGVSVVYDGSIDQGKLLAQYARMVGCRFFDTSGTLLTGLKLWETTNGTVSATLNIPVRFGNTISATAGWNTGYTMVDMRPMNGAGVVRGWTGASAGVSLNFTSSASGYLTLTAIAAPTGTEARALYLT